MLLALLLAVLICTGIGYLLGQPLAGFLVGVVLAVLALTGDTVRLR